MKKVLLTETIWSTVINEEMSNQLIFDSKDGFDKHMSMRLRNYFLKFDVSRYLITVVTTISMSEVIVKEINGNFELKDVYKWEL